MKFFTVRMLHSRSFLPLLLLCMALPAHAVESLRGKVAEITGEDWTISGLEVSVALGESSLHGDLRIAVLEVPAAGLLFADVRVDCGRIELSGTEFGCLAAQFTAELPGTGRETFPGEAIYDRKTGSTRFDLRSIPVAHGLVRLRGGVTETSVDIEFSGNELQLAELAAIAEGFGAAPQALAAAGAANLSGTLQIRNDGASRASLKAELKDASISNEAGTLVTDAMHAFVEITAGMVENRWQFTGDMSADAGEAYIEPVYANLTENGLTFSATGHAAADFSDACFETIALTQGSLIEAAGNLRIRPGADDADGISLSGSIELTDSSVNAIYSGLLQVLLAGTIVGDLDTSGTIDGTVSFDDNEVSAVDLSLRDLSADDKQGRFGIYGLDGVIRWPGTDGEAENAEPSSLHWESASAYNIPLGAGEIEAQLGDDDLRLLNVVRVPTMGGALVLNRLLLTNYGKEDASGLLDAELEPIQLGALTGAFGWPAFSGSLSGQLPLLQYDGGVVTVGGSLTAKAFDGDIEFANLRVEQPFGLVPKLNGDLRLRQLDLEQVTDTFSFGLIQGRLSGDVTGLEMHSWRPVAMDLHLYTPPDDSSRRRISQRAVENLASVGGGGAAAALSSGFLKFFEEFSYRRIGIRCVLQNGTCAMSGAGPAGEGEFGRGYYIVKGSGLPRIDVVGYRHQVSWTALVNQLVNITQSGAPTVN
ncbi:MAG: hypothetical protein WD795_15600 [Woeseia sp.]